jgi:hypothetical protein
MTYKVNKNDKRYPMFGLKAKLMKSRIIINYLVNKIWISSYPSVNKYGKSIYQTYDAVKVDKNV